MMYRDCSREICAADEIEDVERPDLNEYELWVSTVIEIT